MSPMIDDDLRATFAAIADILIPAWKDLPAASGVDVAGAKLDRILSLRDDLKEPLFRALKSAKGKDPETAARALNKDDPRGLAAIGLVASAAYYMDPTIRDLIGYPGQARYPIDPDAPPEYMEDNLLQPVIDRGPFYRPTPR